MRWIEQLSVSQPTEIGLAGRELQEVIHRVLSYRYSRAHGRLGDLPGDPADVEWKRYLEAHLAEHFFERLFVLRREVDALRTAINSQPFVLFHGPRGCGKSTVLGKIHADAVDKNRQGRTIAARGADGLPPSTFHLVDFENVEIPNTTDVERDAAAARALVERLECYFLPDPTDLDGEEERRACEAADSWRLYLTRRSPSHEALRLLIKEVRRPTDRAHWFQALADDITLDARVEATAEFGALSPVVRLDLLLDWVTTELSADHRITLMLDNIDAQPPEIQESVIAVAEKLAHKENRTSTVITARSSTARQHEKKGLGMLGRDRAVRAHVDADLLSAIATRRLEFADEFIRQVVGLQRSNWRYLQSPRLAAPVTELSLHHAERPDWLSARLRVLDQLADHLGGRLTQYLLRWHNYSVRSTCAQLGDVVEVLITGEDPSNITRTPEIHLSKEHVRTLTFRHMVLEGRPQPDTPRILDLLRPSASGPLRFPRLHLLEYIQVSESGVTFSDLVDEFLPLMDDRDQLAAHLAALTERRHYEAEGLLEASIDPERIDASLPLDTVFKAKAAGRFTISTLTRSSEFLMWAALHHPRPEQATGPRGVDAMAAFSDLDRRVEIGADHLTDVVIPAFVDEVGAVTALSDVFDRFGSDDDPERSVLYPVRAVEYLTGYVASRAIDGAADQAVARAQGAVIELLAVFEDCRGRHRTADSPDRDIRGR